MDAEGLGRKLLTFSGDRRRATEKQTAGTVTASHKMLTLQALSSVLNAGTAKRGCLGRGEAFGCPPAVGPPNRPRPFAHYREKKVMICLNSVERVFRADGKIQPHLNFSILTFRIHPPPQKKIAEVLRGNTIRGNATRNSERKMAL